MCPGCNQKINMEIAMTMTPICLFVYNRPYETESVLNSLASCTGAEEHDVIIFSDAPRSNAPQLLQEVEQVRQIIRRPYRFRSVSIREASQNKGLAKSIIEGVTEVLRQYGRAIVLEDDLMFSTDFLQYMEAALDTYAEDKRIWSISGYSPALRLPADYAHALYLSPRASSWGWATWLDRWEDIDWNVGDYATFRRDRKARHAFDLGGNDMSRLLDLQQHGKINSWAIRWCYAQFRKGMYTVYPVKSKVMNQGFGENASHAGWNDARHRVELDSTPIDMIPTLAPDARVMAAFKQHQDLSLISKIGYFIRLHGLGYKKIQQFFKRIIKN